MTNIQHQPPARKTTSGSIAFLLVLCALPSFFIWSDQDWVGVAVQVYFWGILSSSCLFAIISLRNRSGIELGILSLVIIVIYLFLILSSVRRSPPTEITLDTEQFQPKSQPDVHETHHRIAAYPTRSLRCAVNRAAPRALGPGEQGWRRRLTGPGWPINGRGWLPVNRRFLAHVPVAALSLGGASFRCASYRNCAAG
jgi:hypothetical protein